MISGELTKYMGAIVNLETHSPSILGAAYKRAKIISTLDYVDAARYNNISTLHAAMLSSLPPGTTKDFTRLTYLKIQLNNGEITSLALDWIILDTMNIVDQYRRVRLVVDQVSIEDEVRLRRLLTNNDFNIIEMKEDK